MNLFKGAVGSPEIRCSGCGKLLARRPNETHSIQIKCLRCGVVNEIFEAMADQVIITDQDGMILFVNDKVEKITGFSKDEVLGKTPALWGRQMSREFYAEMWRLLREEKEAIVARVTNKHKSGSLYDALLRISPVADSYGEIKFFVGMESLIINDDGQHPPKGSMPSPEKYEKSANSEK